MLVLQDGNAPTQCSSVGQPWWDEMCKFLFHHKKITNLAGVLHAQHIFLFIESLSVVVGMKVHVEYIFFEAYMHVLKAFSKCCFFW